MNILYTRLIVLFLISFWMINGYAQEQTSTKIVDEVSGSIEFTNNGIAILPVFALGKPASILNLRLAKKKWSFEPEIRFALEGKPWSMHFWFRHQTIKKKKFQLRLGIHPALNFRTIMTNTGSAERTLLESRRYLNAEIVPTYQLSERVKVGMYYFYVHGFDDGVSNAHLFLARIAFNQLIELGEKKFYASIIPQVYYLLVDNLNGFYTFPAFIFGKKDCPWTIKVLLNNKVNSNIPSQDFNWNVTLFYKF